ncbi:hypothetical protein GCM10009779_09390 [Polymorphospora rubra]|uniref:Uncharacterized protein n=1 Tax=Polymorphospora rubra TaxID=338584 RepID=A0A810NCK4_9ACTN|nr:hypothetical protein Prubr_66190 [Polymorphospora rubra]
MYGKVRQQLPGVVAQPGDGRAVMVEDGRRAEQRDSDLGGAGSCRGVVSAAPFRADVGGGRRRGRPAVVHGCRRVVAGGGGVGLVVNRVGVRRPGRGPVLVVRVGGRLGVGRFAGVGLGQHPNEFDGGRPVECGQSGVRGVPVRGHGDRFAVWPLAEQDRADLQRGTQLQGSRKTSLQVWGEFPPL